MPQAVIEVNAVIGSDDDVPAGSLVQLSNDDVGDETTYLWAILDQPPGPAVALSNPNIENPTFLATKEGSYLLELVVDQSLAGEDIDRVVVAVRHVGSRDRVPAAGETAEDGPRGWAGAAGDFLAALDRRREDPGLVLAEATGALARGQAVRFSAGSTILAGLPGERRVPNATGVNATSRLVLDTIGVFETTVAGAAVAAANDLVFIRVAGMMRDVGVAGPPAAAAPAYVNDVGMLDAAAGTIARRVGKVLNPATLGFDIDVDGLARVDRPGRLTISPSINADQNDYFPTNWADANIAAITPTGATRTITGFQAINSTSAHGQARKRVTNGAPAQSLVLSHLNGASAAANQMACPGAANLTLLPLASCELEYDRANARWQVVGLTPSFAAPVQGVGGGNAAGVAPTVARSDHDHAIRETGGPADLIISTIAANQAVGRTAAAVLRGFFPLDMIFLGGASMAGGDVGKHFQAQAPQNGTKAAALSSENQMVCPFDGVIRVLTFASATADGTTVFKININGAVASTHTLPGGTVGNVNIATAVNAGDQVAVEFDAGTAPGATNVQLHASRTP